MEYLLEIALLGLLAGLEGNPSLNIALFRASCPKK